MQIFRPYPMLALLALFALGLSLSAFVLEYGFHALPCQMCWWQRYVHWLMVAAAAMAYFYKAPQRGLWMLGLLALVGLGIAAWQLLVQSGILLPPEGCGKPTGSVAGSGEQLLAMLNRDQALPPTCKDVNFTIFGFSLAFWNIWAMGAVLLGAGLTLFKKR